MRVLSFSSRPALFTFLFLAATLQPALAATYSIGGTVSGLAKGDSVTVDDNGKNPLKITKNGAYTYVGGLAGGTAYSLIVKTQPTGQTCAVSHGKGSIAKANVTDIDVACTSKTYAVGGTLTGLAKGDSVTIEDNGKNSTKLTKNGSFDFTTALAYESSYKVTVLTQPAGETCVVTKGTGTVAAAPVTTVDVACTPKKYTIGGTLSGLSSGASVTVEDNGVNPLKLTANGKFTFTQPLAYQSAYKVTVSAQPAGESCTASANSGTVPAANVSGVVIACKATPPPTFSIGGAVSWPSSGVSGSVTLSTNSETVEVTYPATAFTFPTKLATGTKYSVSVTAQPAGGTCAVTGGGSGTIASSNVTDVAVTCTATTSTTYSIGGAVSWPSSGVSGSVTLSTNSETVEVTYPATAFTFPTQLATGTKYSISVTAQPTGGSCSVTGDASGTIGASNITDVAVTCTTSSSGGGGGSYWIPYVLNELAPSLTPAGTNGLILVPSNNLASSPTPTTITSDEVNVLGLGAQYTNSTGTVSYLPQVLMYADTNASGVTQIYGLDLSDTTSTPTPNAIGTPLPSGDEVCPYNATGAFQTDVTQANSLFVVIEIGTELTCLAGTGPFEVVHYTDSASTAAASVSINTTLIGPLYQNNKLTGLLLFDSTSGNLLDYATNAFTSPTTVLTGLSNAQQVAADITVSDSEVSTSGYLFSVTNATSGSNYVYHIDASSLAATQIIQATVGNSVSDGTNLYFADTSSSTNTVLYQVPLDGDAATELYSGPATARVNTNTFTLQYVLMGSNNSVLVFYTYPEDSDTSAANTSATNIYTVPLGTLSSTPTTIGGPYTRGALVPAFLASPSGSGPADNEVFATVRTMGEPNCICSYTPVSYTAEVIPLNGGKVTTTANSVYLPIPLLSSTVGLNFDVWQVTGITDIYGGLGGGTANLVNTSTLADTPIKTTGNVNYVFPAGYNGLELLGYLTNNVAVGSFDNGGALVVNPATTLEGIPVALDLTDNFLWVGSNYANTYVIAY